MKTVELDIRTKSGKLIYSGAHTAPGSWSEMSKRHLVLFAATLCSSLESGRAKFILAAMLYKIPRSIVKYIPMFRQVQLVNSVDFLYRRNELHTWLIPSFRHRLRRYYGPKSRLSNISVEEFKACEFCYEKIDSVKDPALKVQYLDILVSVLYRPRRWFNITDDIRAPLTVYAQEKRAARFRKLPVALKWSIYLNYEGCRNYLVKMNPDVFPKSSGDSGRQIKTTPWHKIIESASGDILGTLDQTEQSNINKFLSLLGKRIREQKEREANQPK